MGIDQAERRHACAYPPLKAHYAATIHRVTPVDGSYQKLQASSSQAMCRRLASSILAEQFGDCLDQQPCRLTADLQSPRTAVTNEQPGHQRTDLCMQHGTKRDSHRLLNRKLTFFVPSLSRISRNSQTLVRVIELLLAHDVPILTTNYPLRGPRLGAERQSCCAR